MGSAEFNVENLLKGQKTLNLESANGKIHAISVVHFEQQTSTSFLDYVFGGCNINLSIAIDFTGSNIYNGERNHPKTLHNPDLKLNQYYKALNQVGKILQYYDSDKQMPVYGFGARVECNKGKQPASHCFALNGDIYHPECNGLE